MHKRFFIFSVQTLLALVCVVQLMGCKGSAERVDRRDERDPLMIRGDARKRAGDVDGAIALYHQALERKPHLAMAHLRLAAEYDEVKKDYLRAIHHYSRYIELRPNAQKRKMIEQLIDMARSSYAASLPNPPPGALEKIGLLERENARLKQQVSDMSERLRAAETKLTEAQAAARMPSISVRPEAAPAAAYNPAPSRTTGSATATDGSYVVQRGDTLSGIASKIYQDRNQWNRIFEANRNVLPSPESIREGQTLVIPR